MSTNNKTVTREKVWTQFHHVAHPDSRFHNDHSSFIPDFTGSVTATSLLRALPCYKNAPIIFVAPDNCLQELRYRALQDGKNVLVTTYAIRRGFYILDPSVIPEDKYEISSLLDGMEKYGTGISLLDIKLLFKNAKIPLMVTGTGAISTRNGLRFGKGHGYFDLEWAMLHEIGVGGEETRCVAVCHELQLVDEELVGEEWDTGCDFIITEARVIEIGGAQKPSCGILWDKLEKGMEEEIQPLGELKSLKRILNLT